MEPGDAVTNVCSLTEAWMSPRKSLGVARVERHRRDVPWQIALLVNGPQEDGIVVLPEMLTRYGAPVELGGPAA